MAKKEEVMFIPEPPLARFLFADTRLSVLWLVVRIYAGLQWLEAGWSKVNNPAWVGESAGTAIHGFFMGALAKATGDHPAVQSWYACFLRFADQHHIFFSYLIPFGELFVGLALILGIFTGIAAFFGSFMNLNFLLSGTVSINPVLFVLEIFLMLAWRTAGWLGLDRYMLPLLGVPWQKGKLFRK